MYFTCIITAKQIEASFAQTKVFDDIEYLFRFVRIRVLGLLRNYQIDVNVGVNEAGVHRANHGSFDTHQTVLFGSMKNGVGFDVFHDEIRAILLIHFHPANVFAASKAPLFQAVPAFVQSFGRAAPQEHERSSSCYRTNVNILYLCSFLFQIYI